MSTRKKVGKIEKRINQTAHQRAMTQPRSSRGLKCSSSLLEQPQSVATGRTAKRVEGLQMFCEGDRQGIRGTGDKYPQVHRASQSAGSDWIATMERTWAEDAEEQSTMSAVEPPCRFPSKIPAKKIVGPVINETSPAQDHAHPSTAQQTKKIASPLSTTVKEPPVVNGPMSRQEVQVGEGTPKTGQRDPT